jgi:hypothetical protein
MVTNLYNKFSCKVKKMITDDDSTIKANCRWSNEDYKKHYGDYPRVEGKDGKKHLQKCMGKLRYPVDKPDFLADPNHKVKTVLYGILSKLYKETKLAKQLDV